MKHVIVLLVTILSSISVALAEPMVRTLAAQKSEDISHDYFTGLLRLLVSDKYQLQFIEHPGQGRAIKLLQDGKYLDVVWSGSSAARNDNLIRVAIPLFKGGLGIRGALLHQQKLTMYRKINDIEGLGTLTICQGRHWPDTDILESSGLQVTRVHTFEAMLGMLNIGRCDLIYLSIFEGAGELSSAQMQYPELVWDTHLLLQYSTAMYFYLNQRNRALADYLELSLIEMMESGEFETYMENHPLTKQAFPLSQYQLSTIIDITQDDADSLQKWVFSW